MYREFLVATKRLYKWVCPSVGRSVGNAFCFGLLGATDVVYTALLNTFVTPSAIEKQLTDEYLHMKYTAVSVANYDATSWQCQFPTTI